VFPVLDVAAISSATLVRVLSVATGAVFAITPANDLVRTMGIPVVIICVLCWMLALFGIPWVLMLSVGLLYGVVVRVVVFISVCSDGTRVGATVVVAVRVIVVVAVAVFVGVRLCVIGAVTLTAVFNAALVFSRICGGFSCRVIFVFCKLFFEIYAGV